MDIPIKLDNNPFTEATEINNEAVEDVLPPELQAEDSPIAQQRPRVTLGRRGSEAELLRERESLSGSQATKWIHRLTVLNN